MKKKTADEVARRYFHSKVQPTTASIDVNAMKPTVELLNALGIFRGQVEFESVKRRGQMVLATTKTGRTVMWPTMAELTSFARSQAILAEGAGVLIPAPDHRLIRKTWDGAAALLLRLAEQDAQTLAPALAEEVADLLRIVWRAAQQPHAEDGAQFIDLMRTILRARRDPNGDTPPAVFIAEESCWTHLPTLRNTLSMSRFTNKLYPLSDCRNGLLLLGFTYCENLTRGHDGDSERLCLWKGPLDVLEG